MASETDKRPHAPWRENIEALTAAIVVALSFKVFFLEVSQIPSGSMQPTLMGSPDADVKDRVLVDKLAYRFREPERFEVVVFQHPNMRSLTMVKRMVGMPGEQLKVEDGNLWTSPLDREEWKVLRKPPLVQRSMWREVDPAGWGRAGTDLDLAADKTLSYSAKGGGISDQYLDGYPRAIKGMIHSRNPSAGQHPVGDLRVELSAALEPTCKELRIELQQGLHSYAFLFPGPAAPPAEACRVEMSDGQGHASVIARAQDERGRLAAGTAARLVAQNLDDEISVELDGETLLRADISHNQNQQSSARLTSAGGTAHLKGLRLLRDLYYTSDHGCTRFKIEAGHYVMLGDNSVDSADGREWQMGSYSWTDAQGRAHNARGNWRPPENPAQGRGANGQSLLFWIDEWGERQVLSAPKSQPPTFSAPYVPRELIKGRAFAIFWPLRPDRGILRFGWVR